MAAYPGCLWAGITSSGSTTMVVRDARDKTTSTIAVSLAFADITSLKPLTGTW